MAGYSITLAQGHGSKLHLGQIASLYNTALNTGPVSASLLDMRRPVHQGREWKDRNPGPGATESSGGSTVLLSTALVHLILKIRK